MGLEFVAVSSLLPSTAAALVIVNDWLGDQMRLHMSVAAT
jgi:hypothetical protein